MAHTCKYTSSLAAVRRWLADDRSDRCEHVAVNPSVAYGLYLEDDSFGPVDRRVMCKACYDNALAEHNAELETCHDCRKRLPRNDMNHWCAYDHYPAQGDEPLPICDECWEAPKHKARIRRDDAARAREDRWYADNDD